MRNSPVRLVAFDLDGTLVDSRKDLVDAANVLIRELGGRPLPDEAITGMIGAGAGLLVSRALAAGGVDRPPPEALERFLAIYDRQMLVHTVVYPGIREALRRATDRARLAVLTNKPGRETARMLDALDLARFFDGTVVPGDGPLPRKPDPAGLQHLMERAGTTPEETMMVGDSAIDLETARRAGTRVCLARWGFGFRIDEHELGAGEIVVDNPGALAKTIEQWTP